MPRPVLAWLTDFGTRDHYAGTMKGVALAICPDAAFVDITHEVPPQDVLGAALELAASYAYFPPGTIFVVVVDPGVGTPRRAIAVEAGGFRFVAPDNGVLTCVLDEHAPAAAVELTERRYARPVVSRTFEGRDRFAPAAAWLAAGVELAALGRPAGSLVRLEIPRPQVTADGIRGEVVRVDRFGNLITNIDAAAFDRLVPDGETGTLEIRIGLHVITRFVTTYAAVPPGGLAALFSSSGHVEIAANGGHAAAALRIDRGAPVHITRGA